MIQMIYPVKKILARFRGKDEICVLCNTAPETVLQTFYNCPYVQLFWTDVERFVRDQIGLFKYNRHFAVC